MFSRSESTRSVIADQIPPDIALPHLVQPSGARQFATAPVWRRIAFKTETPQTWSRSDATTSIHFSGDTFSGGVSNSEFLKTPVRWCPSCPYVQMLAPREVNNLGIYFTHFAASEREACGRRSVVAVLHCGGATGAVV